MLTQKSLITHSSLSGGSSLGNQLIGPFHCIILQGYEYQVLRSHVLCRHGGWEWELHEKRGFQHLSERFSVSRRCISSVRNFRSTKTHTDQIIFMPDVVQLTLRSCRIKPSFSRRHFLQPTARQTFDCRSQRLSSDIYISNRCKCARTRHPDMRIVSSTRSWFCFLMQFATRCSTPRLLALAF